MSATKDAAGNVTIKGVVLSPADIAAINSAQPMFRPLTIVTHSGKSYGNVDVPRYGIAFDPTTDSWTYLDANWNPIPGTSWKAKNLCRSTFTFNMPS